MKWEYKNLNLFFSIFKKFIKNSNNIQSISKTLQHTPCHGARTCTYQGGGGGCYNISHPGPSAWRQITKGMLHIWNDHATNWSCNWKWNGWTRPHKVPPFIQKACRKFMSFCDLDLDERCAAYLQLLCNLLAPTMCKYVKCFRPSRAHKIPHHAKNVENGSAFVSLTWICNEVKVKIK